MDLAGIQAALREQGFDAWLFYDHHHRDPIAYRVLGLPESLHVTRRWFYVIPSEGEPQKLVHRIESKHLDSLPGSKDVYSAWQEQQQRLKEMLSPYKTLAMQYSPNNLIFVVSLVDAGTVELLRSFGKEVVSSANLVAKFEATWTPEQIESHFAAGKKIDGIMQSAWKEIGARVRNGGADEYSIQQWLAEAFKRSGLVFDDAPIVGVNQHAADPHYSPSPEKAFKINNGDLVLLDMWGKLDQPNSTYYDITWTGVVGKPTEKHHEIFRIVKAARDAGFHAVKKAIDSGQKLQGYQVDNATRKTIADAGYGQYFVHRTGHSISTEVHGNGANMDDLEIHDVREILPNSCFSIEPGIYLPDSFGIRLEYNVLVRQGKAEVTGRVQQELVEI
jgi:Xaa-Pro dipeptidase